jgi:type IV pilus assembly protein PilN
MIKINLVPAEILAKAHQRQQMLQASAAGILIAAVLVVVSLSHLYTLHALESQLAEDQLKLKKLEVIVAQVEELEKTRDAVRARLNVVENLLKGRTLYPTFMSDFAASVPSGVRVKNLNSTGGGSAAAPLKLTITAESRTNEDIAGWMRKMEDGGRFSGVELGPVTTNPVAGGGGDKISAFTLNTTYTAPK